MVPLDFLDGAGREKLAPVLARAGTEIHQIVSGAQDIGIVLDDQDGVAEIAQTLEDADELGGVAGMQADGGLVEHVERADKLRSKRRGELDPLRLSAGKRGGQTVERKVIQANSSRENVAAAVPL